MNRVQRVVHLHKYDCVVRPVPSARLHQMCPDCPFYMSHDNENIKETVSKSLEKFNKESGLTNRFALLKVSRASAGMAMSMHYHAEYVIQETTCARSTETPDNCPLMGCEFAHKGFCHGSLFQGPPGAPEHVTVICEIYEPEAAERERKLHALGNDSDHSHGDTQAHTHDHDHDHAHSADQTHSHDHVHDHTQSHAHHDKTLKHADDSDHHHTHDHEGGSHRHAHDHSHDHGHGHDHVHAHHAKAHDHSGDSPNHHHDYKHPDGVHTHEHDHEFALDHDHKHAHLHEHEHHHHHHDHGHETTAHDHPAGSVRVLPAMDQPMTMPSFPDKPVGPVAGDTMTVGEDVIAFLPFPTSVSAECPPPAVEEGVSLVKQLFAEDPLFKPAA
ncbi:hypothetical protein PAMP_023953 [Pampus punctatissimus]